MIAVITDLGWRGLQLAQFTPEPDHIFRQIWVGLLIFLIAILVHTNQMSPNANVDSVILLLLIPLFLYLTLSAHALARLSFIRREHPIGLEGSVSAQERSVLNVLAVVGLVLFVFTVMSGI